VREQVKFGADWIKYYADRRYFLAPDGPPALLGQLHRRGIEAIVDEAHRLGRKVAAHAMAWDGIDSALRAGWTRSSTGWA